MEKTKYMKSSRSTNAQGGNIKIGDSAFEAVQDFIYLGSSVNTENNITLEIKRRIMTANRTLFGLRKNLRSKFVRRNTKLKIYKTPRTPGADIWG